MVWRSVILAAAITAAGTCPAAAESASLRLHKLGTGNRPAVTSPTGGDVAFAANGMVQAFDRTGRRRAHPAPTSCDATAVSSAAVALSCYFPATGITPYLLDRASGRIAPFPLPFPTQRAEITALGARRVLIDTDVPAADGVHGELRRVLLDLATGQTVDLSGADPYGSRRYLDLDAPQPARSLCAPITRSRYSNTSQLVLQRRPIARSGNWFLEQDSTGTAELQRCGKRTKRRITQNQVVLTGDGVVAALGQGIIGYASDDSRRPIILEHLASRRRWIARKPPGTMFVLAAAARRLIISTQTAAGPYSIYSSPPTS